MLTEYDQYVLNDANSMSTPDMDSAVCSSNGNTQVDFAYGYMSECRWPCVQPMQQERDDAYTLTMLDGSPPSEPPPPPAYIQQVHWGMDAGMESWMQHGPAHIAPHVADDNVVSGSDPSNESPDRRCVRSLLHVALQKGGDFAQQFTSCGVPPLPQMQSVAPSPAPPCYPVKQELFVSSTSASPARPVTPADSLRSYSPAYPLPQHQLQHHADDAVVSTTTSFHPESLSAGYSPAPPPPSYSAYRTPYPTPSPDPCYPRVDGCPAPCSAPCSASCTTPLTALSSMGSLAPLVPLPVQMLANSPCPAPSPAAPTTPPSTPSTRPAKRRRNRGAQAGQGAPRKRERSERQLHPCTLCDKRFKDNYSVNVHMRTHTGEKPFPCIVCGKMFRQKAHLAKHRSTHQASEFAAAASLAAAHQGYPAGLHLNGEDVRGVDGNSNTMPLWSESKCKVTNVWTPSIMSPPVSSVQ